MTDSEPADGRSYIYDRLTGAHIPAPRARAALDAYRAEVLREAAAHVLSQRIKEPDGEAEQHLNWVLYALSVELERMARKGSGDE